MLICLCYTDVYMSFVFVEAHPNCIFFIAFDFVDRVNLCPCSIAIIQQLKMSL